MKITLTVLALLAGSLGWSAGHKVPEYSVVFTHGWDGLARMHVMNVLGGANANLGMISKSGWTLFPVEKQRLYDLGGIRVLTGNGDHKVFVDHVPPGGANATGLKNAEVINLSVRETIRKRADDWLGAALRALVLAGDLSQSDSMLTVSWTKKKVCVGKASWVPAYEAEIYLKTGKVRMQWMASLGVINSIRSGMRGRGPWGAFFQLESDMGGAWNE